MNENDFLSENEDLYPGLDDPIPQSLTDVEEDEPSVEDQDSTDDSATENLNADTMYEDELSKAYDDIVKANDLTDVVQIIISANPINSNGVIVGEKLKEFMHIQGKTRIVNSYSSGLLVVSEVESDLEGDDSGELNERREREAKDLIWRFIKYLAERDLSKDSVRNRNRKLRHIPALIIYLFSNKMYGLLINCPYLPEEYQEQVKNALNKINERKYELVDELANMYESVGSNELAAKVRNLKLSFFDKEPAELRTSVEFRDIVIKDSDVSIYKSIRNKYVNISKSITQEVASDLIEVVIDKDAGMYEKLKDKVRTESINEVKQLLKEFSENSIIEKDNDIAIDILLSK
jgi:hypothetical protein